MAKKKNKKIVRYRRPLNINIGMIIFALIFLYMVSSVYTYIKKEKIQFYEVQEGSIVNNRAYTGVALREETVKYTQTAGDISYYVRNKKRAAAGAKVYSIDGTGALAALLKENQSPEAVLSSDNLQDIKKQLTGFSLAYKDVDFSSVYDIQYSIDGALDEIITMDAMDGMEERLAQEGVAQVRADQAGVIVYSIDSLTGLDASGISNTVFEHTSYTSTNLKNGKQLAINDPVYRVITSEKWSVVFPLTEEDIAQYQDKKTLKVFFKEKKVMSTGSFSIITGTDGKMYGKLDFTELMEQFAEERFIDFEIEAEPVLGLKIPVTAVTSKEFYLAPADYLTTGGDSTESGFNKEIITETGNSVVFVPVTVYYLTEEFCYIGMTAEDGLEKDSYIVKPDSADRYKIEASASLQGVYNINKGYALFKQIEVLSSNDEYYTVKKNMDYGLSVFDHIVLRATSVSEGQPIYQ